MKYDQFVANARKTYGDFYEINEMLSRAKSILATVPDLVGKNERLEKENKELKGENAALKAELDDWKGNAEGFEPDAYMRLPVDADGVPIRIGDTVYTRNMKDCIVGGIFALADEYTISVISANNGTYMPSMVPEELTHRAPEPADSWEKLEEDAKKSPCRLVGSHDGNCTICRWLKSELTCDELARLEILKRAKKLAGIEEDAER